MDVIVSYLTSDVSIAFAAGIAVAKFGLPVVQWAFAKLTAKSATK